MQLDMTFFAESILAVYDELLGLVVVLGIRPAEELGASSRRLGRFEERISAFSAEEMQLVIIPLTEIGVVDRDEARIHD
jgi:hypothetical protein